MHVQEPEKPENDRWPIPVSGNPVPLEYVMR